MKTRHYRVRQDINLPNYLTPFAGMIGKAISQPYADTFLVHFGPSDQLEISQIYLQQVKRDELIAPTPNETPLPVQHTPREIIDEDRAAIHDLLDKAGIPPAQGAVCDDPNCRSHLYHRIKWLLEDTARIHTTLDVN